MGTTEFSTLKSTWDDSIDVLKSSRTDSWLCQMSIAVLDIQSGMVTKSTATDRSYLRLKITSALLSKVLASDESVAAQLPHFKEHFEPYCSSIPAMNWSQLFHAISMFGLGTELPELLAEMELAVQELIMREMTKWVESIAEKFQSLSAEQDSCCFTHLLTLITFHIALLIHRNSFKNFDFMVNCMRNIFSLLLLLPGLSNTQSVISDACDMKCLSTMLLNLDSQVVDFQKPHAVSEIESPDLLYHSQIGHLLSAASIQGISGKDAEENSKKLLTVLSDIKHSCPQTEGLKLTEHCSAISSECHKLAEKLLALVQDHFTLHKIQDAEMCAKIRKLLMCMENTNTYEGSVPKKVKPWSYETLLQVITHFLPGYDGAVELLLSQMIECPLKNQNWRETFACLEKCPESLATKSCLMTILSGIKGCVEGNGVDCGIENTITISLKFRFLFSIGFRLLRLDSKMQLCETILSKSELAKFLAEYPMKNIEKDSHKIYSFEQSRSKRVSLFFDGLIKMKAVDEPIMESFCEICLFSPHDTIPKLVEQGMRNEQQAALVTALVMRFGYLLHIKAQPSLISMFWSNLTARINSSWKRSDDAAVDNGLGFINGLLKEAVSLPSGPFRHLVQEIFTSVAVSLHKEQLGLDRDKTTSLLSEKFAIRLLSCLIDIPAFYNIATLEQLATLCMSLGGKIEVLSNLWISDVKFDEESHAIAIGLIEIMVNKIAEMLQMLKDTDANSYTTLLSWILKVLDSFTWTTKLRFLPFLKLNNDTKIKVPSCLSEVCRLPSMFEPSEELSYGPGTGLLPWHQCFIVDRTLCPLASLNIENLTTEDIKLFSSGWICTLSQVLPYSLPDDWCLLLEATKVLIGDFRLYVPCDANHVAVLPAVDICEIHTLLSVVQLLTQVLGLIQLSGFSSLMWLRLSKTYSSVISSLINNSPEFDHASLDAQAFLLSQLFCSACDVNATFFDFQPDRKHSSCSENIFVLLLDIVRSFERIIAKVKAEHAASNEDNVSDIYGTAECVELVSSDLQNKECCYRKGIFELCNCLEEMKAAATHTASGDNLNTLTQKLSKLSDTIKL